MTGSVSPKEKADFLRACVIIPTYNNAVTLAGVIKDVSQYSDHIIVVNDGSTDNTTEIIQSFPAVQPVGYENNKGKGSALRQAFKYAAAKGYKYAITIDSDGQHFAKDLPLFLDKIEENPNSIIRSRRQ